MGWKRTWRKVRKTVKRVKRKVEKSHRRTHRTFEKNISRAAEQARKNIERGAEAVGDVLSFSPIAKIFEALKPEQIIQDDTILGEPLSPELTLEDPEIEAARAAERERQRRRKGRRSTILTGPLGLQAPAPGMIQRKTLLGV